MNVESEMTDAKVAEKKRLAEALRANLRRRKAASAATSGAKRTDVVATQAGESPADKD